MTSSSGTSHKKVRRSVLLADRVADMTIKIGGILVIAAVLGILVFLVYEAAPLFRGGNVVSRHTFSLGGPPEEIIGSTLDEYRTVGVAVTKDGGVLAFHTRTGSSLEATSFDFEGKRVTASAATLDGNRLAFGFSDGTVRLAELVMETEILPLSELPKGLKTLDDSDSTDGRSVFSIVPGNQVRKVTVKASLGEEMRVSETGKAITAMDYSVQTSSSKPRKTLVTVDDSGSARLSTLVSKKNLMTGKVTEKLESYDFPPLPVQASITYAVMTSNGEQVYLAETSGRVYRFDSEGDKAPVLAESLDLLPKGVALTAFGMIVGEQSLVAGGADGSLSIFFRLRREHTGTPSGYGLILTRRFDPHRSKITGVRSGVRGRTFLTADESGDLWLRHATSQKTLLRLKVDDPEARFTSTALAPRGNGVLTFQTNGKATFWDIDIPHPETSVGTLFGKVWYEGYPAPGYTWQSSAATDDFETKLSIVPLIFGTLKATFYSLLFAIPVALCAAIYTSEFMHPSVRSAVKPVMETMASLPSVILGFVAALVLAPIVESWIAAIILALAVAPLSLVAAAHLWQMIPYNVAVRLQGIPKLILICLVLVGSCIACYVGGLQFERLFFSGDFKAWLNGGTGSATPFLFMLLMPVVSLLVAAAVQRLFGGHLDRVLSAKGAFMGGLLQIMRWMILMAAAAGISYALAVLLQAFGVDARGELVGTYGQRNTLIVGFAMGFAVIPIIYTLAEDALNSVPDHLRSASLACGATHWQTAMWVILPTAMSGVFSAVMIGMGRAVGETMIVVMAAGNTPLIDLNVFNGLRALSANIAVELPEAVKDGTLYRVLFLTALVLFSMTFVINTVAEAVRLRFRKRAMQL